MKGRFGSFLLIAAVFGAVSVSPLQAATPQASAEQVRELIKVTGGAEMMHRMMTQMIPGLSNTMQEALPCVPASYWNGFANKQAEQDLINRIIPIYQKHFSSEDVADLLKFYRTRVGRKVLEEMPGIMSETMRDGQAWGRKRAQQMIDQLQKEGTLNAQGSCPVPEAGGKAAGDTGGDEASNG
ncbi:MAG: DUF2059 domain-containing protein [Rhodanobacteraceae bacterium]